MNLVTKGHYTMATYKVIFKNAVDREAFIGLQNEFLSLPGVTFDRSEWQGENSMLDDPKDNGKPMIVVNNTIEEMDFDKIYNEIGYDRYEKALFDFTYLKCVPGSTRKLVDFTSGDDTGR